MDFPLIRVGFSEDSGGELFVAEAVGVGLGTGFTFNFDVAVGCAVVGCVVLLIEELVVEECWYWVMTKVEGVRTRGG